MTYKLGSLFDGSGGFPLSGALCGIEPVWAAEVEPYPIAVTRSRFPDMKHLGDISKVNGADIEPVDIITFGSPCQDLSVAGKRAGLKHEANGDDETTRSGLFMEAVRIIKEMREATNGEYPTFALWENVPGAFSSNKGQDFRIVLEELIRVVEPHATMPAVPKAGWNYADYYHGDGWSLAYRVFDAQYWGVPQRRRRIHLVVDFRGQRAREVLFEREGVRGYFAEGRTPWQAIAGDASDCAGADDRAGEGFDGYNGDLTGDVSATLGVNCGVSTGRNGVILRGRGLDAVAYTLKIRSGVAVDSAGKAAGKGPLVQVDKAATLSTTQDQYLFAPTYALDQQGGSQISVRTDEKSPTLRAEAHGNVPAVVCKTWDARGNCDGDKVSTLTGDHENRITDYTSVVAYVDTTHADDVVRLDETVAPLQARDYKGGKLVACLASGKETVGTLMANAGTKLWLGNQEAFSGDYHIVEGSAVRYIVRRLTPTECARLQGFADRWGDIDEKDSFTPEEYEFWLTVRNTHAAINGKAVKDYTEAQMLTWYNKLHTDGAEYKMWGNGIALPPALYCLQGIVDALETTEDDDWMY